MHLTAAFLVCLLAGPQSENNQAEPLTNEDLLEINEEFAAVYEYDDNAFLYEQKLGETMEGAQKYEGRPVSLVAHVLRVTKGAVEVVLFPQPEGHRGFYPGLAFADPGSDGDIRVRAGRPGDPPGIGGTVLRHSPAGRFGELRVDKLVPTALAKTLREGDQLRVAGKLTAVKHRRFSLSKRRRDIPLFVISSPEVEKVSEKSGESKESD